VWHYFYWNAPGRDGDKILENSPRKEAHSALLLMPWQDAAVCSFLQKNRVKNFFQRRAE